MVQGHLIKTSGKSEGLSD